MLKRRDAGKPIAILCSDVDMLLECVPELRGRAATVARALFPGPYTLIFPNPAGRYRWITGTTPQTLGVRVPDLPSEAGEVLSRVGAVLATSANVSGGPEPRRLEEVPTEIRSEIAAEIDAGELPGVPSTVVDLSGP